VEDMEVDEGDYDEIDIGELSMPVENAVATFTPHIPSLEQLSPLEQLEAMSFIFNMEPKDNPAQTLKGINSKLRQLFSTNPDSNTLLWHGSLSPTQMKTFEQLNQMLRSDYSQRKEVLLKRFEATAQTFSWSPELIQNEEDAKELQAEIDNILIDRVPIAFPNFTFHDVLVADSTLLSLSLTTRANLSDGSLKNFMLHSTIPDRGGRCGEEPQFTKRTGVAHRPEDFQATASTTSTTLNPGNTNSTTSNVSAGRGRAQGNWGRGNRGNPRGKGETKAPKGQSQVKRTREDGPTERGRGGKRARRRRSGRGNRGRGQ